MHDFFQFLPSLITSIGSLIGAIVIGFKAFGSSRKDNFSEIRTELKEKNQDAELYRERWKKAEESNEALRREVEKLRKELKDAKHKSN